MTEKKLGPEKIVEKEVLVACEHLGFSMDVIDSKATFSQRKQRYTSSRSVPEGFPDLIGCDSHGVMVAIELKAPGKLKTIRPKQALFLEKKIQMGAFACCVDSGDLLFELYLGYKQRGRADLLAHLYSISHLN